MALLFSGIHLRNKLRSVPCNNSSISSSDMGCPAAFLTITLCNSGLLLLSNVIFSVKRPPNKGCNGRIAEIEKGLLLFNVRSLPPFEAFIHPPKSWSKYCGSQRERTSPSPKAFLLFTSSTKVTGEGSIRNKSLNESITHLFTCCPLEYGTHTPNTESQ